MFDWLDTYWTPFNLRQFAAVVTTILFAVPLAQIVDQYIKSPGERDQQTPHRKGAVLLANVALLARRSLRPLMVWLLLQLAVQLFIWLGWSHDGLQWTVPLSFFWLVYRIVSNFLSIWMKREKAELWIRQLLRPIFIVVLVLYLFNLIDDVLKFGIKFQETNITIGALLAGSIVTLFFLLISQILGKYLRGTFLPQAGVTPALSQALSTIAAYLIIAAGFLIGLNVVGLDLTTLTVIIGGLSVGIGIGLQEIVTNFISGFILLFEGSISPGDVVQIGEHIGRVQEVGFRSMRIITPDNVDLVVPNSTFVTDIVTNYTRGDHKVRVKVAVNVSYNSEPRQVEQALLTAAQHEWTLPEPSPNVLFAGFEESALLFELQVWTDNPFDKRAFISALRYQIWAELKARQIEIPYPQRDVHIRSHEGVSLIGNVAD